MIGGACHANLSQQDVRQTPLLDGAVGLPEGYGVDIVPIIVVSGPPETIRWL